ncbi:copper transporter [Petroclostridium sp. X23]|uniref:copper transporter n=1 Tax=Petroclostridium sp. X23 TaxID=3045146 RepID=UPI0024AD37A0|nr:copper transporter [Petroclostridium sp. X23]WHH59911.1 copper transporter [Petroclostridium sp. X23]
MSRGITYHIMTIAAIFIAMGLGIFIGSMLNGEQLVMMQQSKLMSELGEHLQLMTQENKELKTEIKSLSDDIVTKSELIDSIFEEYLRGSLQGYNVAIIATGGRDLCDEIISLLQVADANIRSVTSVKNISETDIVNVFNQMQYYQNPMIAKESNMATYAAEHLMYSILSGKNSGLIDQFADMDYIDSEGDYSEGIDHVIWVGPNTYGSEYVEKIDIPMLDIVKKMDIPCLIVGRGESEDSSINMYKKSGFSAINNIETTNGKVALTMKMKEQKEKSESIGSETGIAGDLNRQTIEGVRYEED